MWKPILRLLASLRLAISLLVVLASVLAWASLLEADRGREVAHWYVYGSTWFVGLLGVLGVNILAAAVVRFPWRRHQTGFVLTHAGLLVVLAGSILTFLFGIEGHVVLNEGDSSDQLELTDRSLITAVRNTPRGRVSTDFSFRPGPVDWLPGASVDFGREDDFGLQVVGFYRHAQHEVNWVADDTDYQGPALRLKLDGPSGTALANEWLTGNAFGGEAVIGPTRYELLPLPLASMVADFVEPPMSEAGTAGILSVHYDGNTVRIPIDENLGRTVPLGDSGLGIELVEYLPNAKPKIDGGFASIGDVPKNPLVELRLHGLDDKEPLRQVAFAKRPLLNLDAVHGFICPVKFWYHHPDISYVAGAVFAQAPDDRLFARSVIDGSLASAQEVSVGSRVELAGKFTVTVQEFIPRVREEVTFTPAPNQVGASSEQEAAVLLEVTDGDTQRRVWLQRDDNRFGFQTLITANGPLSLSLTYDHVPLGFNLELEQFARERNPGAVGDAAVASHIRLRDVTSGLDEQHVIGMNQPLKHGQFTVYQAGFEESGHGKTASLLSVAYDPGRVLKYLGGLMICVGIFTMFTMRSYSLTDVSRALSRAGQASANAAKTVEPARHTPPAPRALAPNAD